MELSKFITIINSKAYIKEATKKGYTIANVGDSINLEQPNSKTRRGRVGGGMCNTLTTSCNIGVFVEVNMDKVIRCGQVSNEGSQAGMVYNTDGLFPTVCACTHGYAIGNIKEEQNKIKTNINKNYNIKGESVNIGKIKLFDSFAGVGALHSALKRLGVEVELVGVSEIDPDAIISYAGVHKLNWQDVELKTDEEMKQFLIDRNIGYDFTKNKSSIPRMKKEKLHKLYKCVVAMNNLGDVSKLDYNKISVL